MFVVLPVLFNCVLFAGNIMPQTCCAPGCTTGYKSKPDSDRHTFSVPVNKFQ